MRIQHRPGKFEIFAGNSADILRELPSNSVSSMVTDPPGGVDKAGTLHGNLSQEFVSNVWDNKVYRFRDGRQVRQFMPSFYAGAYDRSRKDGIRFRLQLQSIFTESHRVLKPGAFVLAWSANRTYHWTATALENSGFEISDVVIHLTTNGVPMWGNLKPMGDIWVMARKRPEASIKETERRWGTGRLSIDRCRVGRRYPANVVLSHGPECGEECLPGCPIGNLERIGRAHYFYQARNRKAQAHPTVKPVELMRYLCRLITPEGGVILDPFMGAGSTGEAALLEGYRFVGIEIHRHYAEAAQERLLGALETRDCVDT